MLDLILAREVYSFNTLLILMVTTEQNLILGGKSLLDLQKLKFLAFCALIQAFNYFFAPCRGIRSPHSKKLLVVSGIRKNFACKIRNPGFWNLEYSSRNPKFTNNWNPESKLHCQRLESSTWNPESTAWNPESKTVLDSLTRGGSFFVGALVVGEEKEKKSREEVRRLKRALMSIQFSLQHGEAAVQKLNRAAL